MHMLRYTKWEDWFLTITNSVSSVFKAILQSYEVELTIEDSNFRTTHCVLEYEDADDEWIDVCCEDGEVDCEGTTPLNDEWEERVETEEADCKGQEE